MEKYYQYQVGGSLPENSPTYVVRQADFELFDRLKAGDFCYVLNSRQMGKSSLLVRTMQKLINEGISCASIDISDMGSKQISLEQWYGGVAYKLVSSFNVCDAVEFMTWWRDRELISPVQRLSDLIEHLLLEKILGKIVIFIDEIDSVLSFQYCLDDFFALIRSCYNKRSQNVEYHRLTFALLGVGTPSDLIADRTRTPFNIGKAISLNGFSLAEAQPLAKGLAEKVENSQQVLADILNWTGGQPFLTQKLCQIILNTTITNQKYWLDDLVRSHIIENWEFQDEPVHIKTVRDRLLRNQQKASKLLGIYQKILQDSKITADDSPEQTELQLSGLVVKKAGYLQVNNRIYASIFNQNWVEKSLFDLRPYAEALAAWLASKCQDESRLLRGQALQDAREWATNKNLSSQDYQFLTASQEYELAELRQKEQQNQIEISRLYREKELLEKLNQEQKQRKLTEKQLRRERILRNEIIMRISAALVSIIAFLIGVFWVKSSIENNKEKMISMSLFSESLLEENQYLDSLRESIKAGIELKSALGIDSATQMRVLMALHHAVYSFQKQEKLTGHNSKVTDVNFSPDNQIIASASADKTIKLWQQNSKFISFISTLAGHSATIYSLNFSPNSKILASASADKTIKLWQINGNLITTLKGHNAAVYSVIFSPDGKLIASASGDGTIKLWQVDGKLINTLNNNSPVYSISFSPDGKKIAAASGDRTVKIWQHDGKFLYTLKGHNSTVLSVSYSRDGTMLASASADGIVKLWDTQGKRLSILKHNSKVNHISFSPDSQIIVSGSADGMVRLWYRDGTLIKSLKAHENEVLSVNFSLDNKMLASGSADKNIILWNLQLEDLLIKACQNLGDRLNNTSQINQSDRYLCNDISSKVITRE